jgi:hypothetical protein
VSPRGDRPASVGSTRRAGSTRSRSEAACRARGASPPAATGKAAGRVASRSTGTTFPHSLLDYMAAGDEKSTYLARGKLRGRRGEISVEAREDQPLAPSPDESSVEELLQVRVGGEK